MINIAQKTVAVIVILLFLGAGFFIGSLAGGFVGQLTVPASHKTVANAITVYDNTAKKYLTLHYIGSDNYRLLSTIPLSEFSATKTYVFTYWTWGAQNQPLNPEVYMVLAGPGDDGITYGVELAKCAWDELKVTMPNGKVFVFPQAQAAGEVSPGYVGYEFIP